MKIQISPGHHGAILGKTGAGKSYATRHYFMKFFKKQVNGVIVILDNKREYTEVKNVAKSPRELNHMLYGQRNQKKVPKIIRAIPSQPTEQVAEDFLKAAWGPNSEYDGINMDLQPKFGVRFFIEDMPTFYDSPYKTPYYLRYWVTTGRSYQRTVWGTSQRAQLIPKTFLSMVDHIFVFSMSDYDIDKYLVPIHGYQVGATVKALPQWGYALVSDLIKEPIGFGPVKGPKEKSKKGIIIPVEYG
jgi:hypothetical protein